MSVLLAENHIQQDNLDLSNVHFALFKPKVEFELHVKNYTIQTAVTSADLRQLIQLRRHSFFDEFMGTNAVISEFDEYDQIADHVIVKNRITGEILGCYRMICSDFSNKFYSEEQFGMADFLKDPSRKIELSRACIHKEHRNGITLSLVWKGLAHYASLVNAQYLFGCASVKATSPRLAYSMLWNLYPYHYDDRFDISVLPKYRFPQTLDENDILPYDIVKDHIPPLLKTYLKAGAKICSEPALDTVFRCFDFFTVLDLAKMNEKYQEKYF